MSIFHLVARKIISRLANLTSNVIYYPEMWAVRINGGIAKIASKRGDGSSALTIAATSMACAMHEHLPKMNDAAEINLIGVSHGDAELGNFIVVVRRVT